MSPARGVIPTISRIGIKAIECRGEPALSCHPNNLNNQPTSGVTEAIRMTRSGVILSRFPLSISSYLPFGFLNDSHSGNRGKVGIEEHP
jgi:hypothetical protein